MNADALVSKLKNDYPGLIFSDFENPDPYIGNGGVKAIILGADPTHIVHGTPQKLNTVFQLDNEKSPYWRGIGKNISLIDGLSMSNIHVENLCRNYFTKETSQNKLWIEIARNYWSPFLADELDELYSPEIPVLITTQFILFSILINHQKKIKASDIYENHLVFPSEQNLLRRKILAFYRHPKYSLSNWPEYSSFISNEIFNTH